MIQITLKSCNSLMTKNYTRHPHSIDALCNLPSSYPSAHSTILTGSSDGLLRAVQLFPTKLLGVVADHGDYPIERIAIDRDGEGTWVGSVGHDEVLRITNLKDVFEDDAEEGDEESENDGESDSSSGRDLDNDDDEEKSIPIPTEKQKPTKINLSKVVEEDKESGSDSDEGPKEKKRKRKVKDPLSAESKKKKLKGEFATGVDSSFFSGL